ncbi:MAG: class B sortase [Bacilli bacterium]|nr:class B sortase [Bacilli bacterium]
MKKDVILNKILNIINHCVNNFVIITLVFLFLISSYAIFDKYQVYEDAKISQDIEDLRPKDDDVTFSLPELRKLNPEISGWIKIYDTNMDYPFVKGKDNTKYLTYNYKGEDTGVGSIFMDYRNNFELKDDYTIIYGHNLQANLMFSGITKYKSKKYFKNHLDGELHTTKGDYKIEIFSYALLDASKEDIYDLMTYRNDHNEHILSVIKDKSIQYKDIGIKPSDKLILLSTCDTTGTYTRSVLLARISKVTDVLTSITTKASKLADNELETIEEEEYEAPLVKETPKPAPKKFTISIYNLVLILTVIVVIIIYIVLFLRQRKLKKIREEKLNKQKNSVVMTPPSENINNNMISSPPTIDNTVSNQYNAQNNNTEQSITPSVNPQSTMSSESNNTEVNSNDDNSDII